MESLAAAFKSIFDKLSDFFNLFDLSFFVSGLATATSIYILIHYQLWMPVDIGDGYRWFALIIFCYLAGLISFSVGAAIRSSFFDLWGKLRKKPGHVDYPDLLYVIQKHGAEHLPFFKKYIDRPVPGSMGALYTRMWAIVRENDKLASSISLMKRYWVMSATYDGLTFSLLCWAVNFCFYWNDQILGPNGHASFGVVFKLVVGIAGIVFLAGRCVLQAYKYKRFQIEELTAVFIEYHLKGEYRLDI